MLELIGDAARWHEMSEWLAVLGNYWAHAILSSLISVLAAQGLIRIWPRRSPSLISRLAFLSVVLPPLAVPLYDVVLGGPDSLRQRLALVRPDGWLHLASGRYAWVPWVVIPLALLTALPFVYEGVSALVRSHRQEWQPSHDAQLRRRVSAAGRSAAAKISGLPPLIIVQRAEPVAWVSGLFHPAILLSEELVRILDQEELEAVVAHECAHIKRGDTWTGYVSFLSRAMLLFNPAVTWACWQMAVNGEQACDRWAATRTSRHLALGSALIKIDRAANGQMPSLAELVQDVRLSVRLWEGAARRTLLRERVERLLQDDSTDSEEDLLPGLLTLAGIVLLALFFVV